MLATIGIVIVAAVVAVIPAFVVLWMGITLSDMITSGENGIAAAVFVFIVAIATWALSFAALLWWGL